MSAMERLVAAVCVIGGTPLFWNVVARSEHRTRFLTKMFGGNGKVACYFLALAIFLLGVAREGAYESAVAAARAEWKTADSGILGAQCGLPVMDRILAANPGADLGLLGKFGPFGATFYALQTGNVALLAPCDMVALLLGLTGTVFVAATYYRLGITGTYLGDYFGILLPARITGFPFSVLSDPMYDGAVMLYVAMSLIHRSYVGLFLAFWTWVVYQLAEKFEGPFTAEIYAARDRKLAANKKK